MSEIKTGDKFVCVREQRHVGDITHIVGKEYECIHFSPGIGISKKGILKLSTETGLFDFVVFGDMDYFHHNFIKSLP